MRRWSLGLLFCVWPLVSLAGTSHFLLTILPPSTQSPDYLPVSIDEDVALRAATPGAGMWIPLPSGVVHLYYRRTVIHPDGTWTWIGTVGEAPNLPKAVITFGNQAVFGTIPTAAGKSWHLTTLHGKTLLADSTVPSKQAVQAAPVMLRPSGTSRIQATSDRVASDADVPAATADHPAIVDLLVVYTPEFVAQFGSLSAAMAFIEYQVDTTNQAFSDSQVYGRIRLVEAAQTSIPDYLDSLTALQDLQSDSGVRALRNGYGADVVAMAQSTVSGCRGAIKELGYNLTPIPPGPSGPAYLVWGDDGTGACESMPSYGLAEFLGFTFGLTEQPDYRYVEPGAYPFSYGYEKPGTSEHAQGTLEIAGARIWPYFSNPNINLCDGLPCGVPDVSDAARSLNLTLPIIATFAPTRGARFNDVDHDGKSDLKWYSSSGGEYGGGRFAYWLMNGSQLTSSKAISLLYGNTPLATGDFNGDGHMDVLWKFTASNGVFLHMGYGTSFSGVYMRPYPTGWTMVGTGDVDGDGKTDLIWSKGNEIAEWLMNGIGFTSYLQTLPAGWRYIGIGDFDDDLKSDLLLTNGSAMQMWTTFNNGSFADATTHAYPSRWTLLGTGDVDGDGMADLLWRDNSHTHFAYWIMVGSQLSKSWEIAVTPQWKLGTSGDFNGDGLLDLVWYNTNQIVMWPGTIAGNYQGVVVHSYPSGWAMLP